MSELSSLVTQILSDYKGYMRFSRLLRLVERVGRHFNPEDVEAVEFICRTLGLVYEMGMKEKIYGVCDEAIQI